MQPYNVALDLARTLLAQQAQPTRQSIRAVIDQIAPLAPGLTDADRQRLADDLEYRFNIWVGRHSLLEDQTGHEPWLAQHRGAINWEFWQRYRRYLEKDRDLPPNVVRDLHETTDTVLGQLEHPEREGRWNRRGMVVGSVQSGKTANYLGLICKAIDAGYRLVIVLAGMLNNLRSQTQVRLDLGVLGFDTRLNLEFDQANQRIGAGAMAGEPLLIVNSMTSSAENGDFSRTVARNITVPLGGRDPMVLVVKKNKSVLENLIAWSRSVRGELDPVTGRRIIRGVPFLIVDDEADHASVNTNEFMDEDGRIDPECEPTTINRLIRNLMHLFEKRAYVGYTATPFANIFIHPEARAEAAGDDLFPASFIYNLKPPSNYIGPAEVFGLDADPDAGTEGVAGLPIRRPVTDSAAFIPPKHTKHLDLTDKALPPSLQEAIRVFILSCAAKLARGMESTHSSMLVHVTRFNDVQAQVADKVRDELEYLQRQLEFGPDPKSRDLFEELERLWNEDFQRTTARIRECIDDPKITHLPWSDLQVYLRTAASRIKVKVVNGTAGDALDYADHGSGLWTIAIGGDKLSRGLTLEGLCVSYFTRTSRMYDTLMQMGRWFGFRPGYVDLCRLYTNPVLIGWYRHIAGASEELRSELDHMADVHGTPLDYGLKVAAHPDGMIVTAPNKMRAAQMARVSYSGAISESVAFALDEDNAQANYTAFDTFLGSLLQSPNKKNGCLVWEDVLGANIADLFSSITTHPLSWRAQTEALEKYIRNQTIQNELKKWTVALVASGRGKPLSVGGQDIRASVRNPNGSETDQKYSIGRLVDPQHEWIDLSATQFDNALNATADDWAKDASKQGRQPRRPSGKQVRRQRLAENGLLLIYPIDKYVPDTEIPLIGFAVSFPFSENAEAVDYAVNRVAWEQEFG